MTTPTYFTFAATAPIPVVGETLFVAEYEWPCDLPARRKCVRGVWTDEQRAAFVTAGGIESAELPLLWRRGEQTWFVFAEATQVPQMLDGVLLDYMVERNAPQGQRRKAVAWAWSAAAWQTLLAAGGAEHSSFPQDWARPATIGVPV